MTHTFAEWLLECDVFWQASDASARIPDLGRGRHAHDVLPTMHPTALANLPIHLRCTLTRADALLRILPTSAAGTETTSIAQLLFTR
eukprot:2937189-Amphidinium_carterae.2